MKLLRLLAVLVPLVLAAVVLDALLSLVVPGIRVLDPFLLVTVWFGANGRRLDGMLAGAVAGLVQDATASMVLGCFYLPKVVVGYVTMLLAGRLIPGQPTTHAILIAVGAVTEMLVVGGLGLLLGRDLLTVAPLSGMISVLVNVGAGCAAYAAIERARRRREKSMGHGLRGR